MATSFDITQAKRQIELLGLGTEIFLRGFYHSDDPRKTEDKGRKSNKLDVKTIESWIADQRGVYIVVNGGGHEDKKVSVGRAIFYEHDNLDKDLQRSLWQQLKLPEPTCQVDTGDKSIHSYWVFEKPIPIEKWRKLQAELLEFADADRSIKNPSRVMRLAGATHQKGGKVEIITDSGQKYSFEQLRSLIPEPKKPEAKTSYQPSMSDEIPLYNCLSRDDRQLIDSGIGQGSRNTAGAKIARNLIGTAKRLTYLGHRFEGSPQGLFELFCSRCNPRLDDREATQIWKSAEKDNPTATLSDDALENCVKAFYRQSKIPGINSSSSTKFEEKIQAKSQTKTNSMSAIRQELQQLINSNLSESRQEEKLQEIAGQYHKTDPQIHRLYKALVKESEAAENIEEQRVKLEQLIKIDSQTIKLSDFLHPYLAKPLGQISEWLGMPDSAVLTILLPTAASLMPINARLELIKPTGFYAYPILYTGLVGESGIGKSPLQKLLINPLFTLQDETITEHNQALEDWGQACSFAKRNNEPEPPPPKQHHYFTTDATSEAVAGIQNDQPERGFLGLQDELEGLFKSTNAYRGGRGADNEKLLSGRDGTGFKVDRSNGKRLFVKRSGYSITGGIQPDILRKRIGDLSDSNGQWARFIWDYLGKVDPAPYPESDMSYDSHELLHRVYLNLERQPSITHEFSPSAKQQYKQWYNHLNSLIKQESRQGMRSVFAKMKRTTGEFALILHRLNAAIVNQDPSVEVDGQTMAQAIALAQYYLNQVKLIHTDAEGETVNGNPTGKLKKILELSERKGTISARDVKNAIWQCRKMTSGGIRSDFMQLETMGYGQTEGEGNKLKFKTVDANFQTVDVFEKTVDVHQHNAQTSVESRLDKSQAKTVDATVDATVDVTQNAEILAVQTVQPLKTQTVDGVDAFSKEITEFETTEEKIEAQQEGMNDTHSRNRLMEFYSLATGDILVVEDSAGVPQAVQLVKKQTYSNTWITNRKTLIVSLSDWKSGQVRRPTVEDVATLIKRNPTRKSFRWFYRNLEDLQIKAIELLAEQPENEELVEQLYEFLNPLDLSHRAHEALDDLKKTLIETGKVIKKKFLAAWGEAGELAIQFAEEEGRIRISRGSIQAT